MTFFLSLSLFFYICEPLSFSHIHSLTLIATHVVLSFFLHLSPSQFPTLSLYIYLSLSLFFFLALSLLLVISIYSSFSLPLSLSPYLYVCMSMYIYIYIPLLLSSLFLSHSSSLTYSLFSLTLSSLPAHILFHFSSLSLLHTRFLFFFLFFLFFFFSFFSSFLLFLLFVLFHLRLLPPHCSPPLSSLTSPTLEDTLSQRFFLLPSFFYPSLHLFLSDSRPLSLTRPNLIYANFSLFGNFPYVRG